MGLFAKLKKIIKNKEIEESEISQKYDEGLKETRKNFVNELNVLGLRFSKIDEEYFEELENILIMADIGVNTVMNFMERLRKRVKEEKITNPQELFKKRA